MKSKDAAVIKALEELGLRKNTPPVSDNLSDISDQLDKYKDELGKFDAKTLQQYIIRKRQ